MDHHHHPSQNPSETSSVTGLKDPVCGMSVTEQSFYQSSHGGITYFFCSARCQTTFAANPSRYVTQQAGTNHQCCHTHQDQRDPSPDQPGTESVGGAIYTCPMHPEIRQSHSGSCPKCGMALEPLLPDLDDEDNPELRDFNRRFWWTLPLTVVVATLAMFGHQFHWFDALTQTWIN